MSGIVHVKRNGLRWRDASVIVGPHKTRLGSPPRPERILGDRGCRAMGRHRSEEDRKGRLASRRAQGLRLCIPARRGRRRPASHNKRLYTKRCRIENAFARLKDWWSIATRLTRAAAASSCPPSPSPQSSPSGCGCEAGA